MNKETIHPARRIANHFFWLFIAQGILFVLMAFLVIIYPPIIILMIVSMFLCTATIAFIMAWKVRGFWKETTDLFIV